MNLAWLRDTLARITLPLSRWLHRSDHRLQPSAISTPSEHLLLQLLDPRTQALAPVQFLDQATAALASLDWVEGVVIRGPERRHQSGTRSGFANVVCDETLTITIYTHDRPQLSHTRHMQLLGRVVDQLWHARRRDAALRSQMRVRTVHEAGAQLTHDMKNLLQSLQTLAGAVSTTPPEQAGEAMALVRRQLPSINQRLQATLQKLQDPGQQDAEPESVTAWWQRLCDRYPGAIGRLVTDGTEVDTEIPGNLFDTVAENLLENARQKRRNGRPVDAVASLTVASGAVVLEVSDDGDAIPESVTEHLFIETVDSTSGLGIGLYQCAQLAQQHGYRLRLVDNENGWVRFELAPTDTQPATD